jgi:hypothetical protein
MSDAPVIDYGTKRRRNLAAAASLALGLMLFVPLLTGIAGIVLGRRGMRLAREHAIGGYRMARAGAVLGVLNVLLCIIAASVLSVREYRAAQRRQCANNFRQLGLAMLLYSNSNRGQYPPTFDELVTTGELPKGSPVFTCPVCRGDALKKPATVTTLVTSSYVMGPPPYPPPPLNYGTITLVTAYEPPANHGGQGMHVLTNHGRVHWIGAPLSAKVVAELQSGENPPKSLKGVVW